MRFWLINTGEPTPLDSKEQRLRRVGQLSDALAGRGHDVLWFNSTYFHLGKRQRFDQETTVDIQGRYRVHCLHGPAYRKNVSLARLRNHAALGRSFRRYATSAPRPDLILASLPTIELAHEATRYGRANGVPVVVDVRDLWPESFLELAPGWARGLVRAGLAGYFRMARSACASATAVCGNSEGFVRWGIEMAGRERAPQDRAFPFGYQAPVTTEQELRDAEAYWDALGIGRDAGTLVACFFGAINHHFDFATVLSAARRLQAGGRMKFVFCGDGADRARLEAATADLPDVHFTGWVSAAHIWSLMQRAHLGLAPYVDCPNFRLNLPNKPIEYLAGGLPFLSSLTTGPLAELARERGCGATYDSVDALVEAIERWRGSPERLAAASSKAREVFAERFDADTIYNEMMDHLEAIAREKARLYNPPTPIAA